MIDISTAAESDIDGIAALEQEIFTDAWSRRSVGESIGRDYITVVAARESGRVIGYIICYHILNEGEIMRIAVDVQYRRRSVARRMFEYLFHNAETAKLQDFSLEVRESNLAARALYHALSFEEEGRRRQYYHDPEEDALILWRRIHE